MNSNSDYSNSNNNTGKVIPKWERPFDILVYGASGFTGKKVAQYIVEYHPKLKLAISGRSLAKLQQCAKDINLPTNDSGNNVIAASTSNMEELTKATSLARVVLACAGPYRHPNIKADAIVHAAILTNTDYLDLCGEPQFFDDMFVHYDALARSNNTLVLSSCAFDCVPSELSAKFVARELRKKQQRRNDTTNNTTNNGGVAGIEIVHTFHDLTCGNPATFHAAVDGFYAASTGQLKNSRDKVNATMKRTLDALTDNNNDNANNNNNNNNNVLKAPPRPKSWNTKLPKAPGMAPVHHKRSNQYLLKFIGADAACVLSSDRYLRYRAALQKTQPHAVLTDTTNTTNTTNIEEVLSKPSPKLSICFGIPTKSNAYKFLAYGAVFSTLAKYKFGCDALHSNPELFSNGCFREGGPTEEELKKGRFETLSVAYGPTYDDDSNSDSNNDYDNDDNDNDDTNTTVSKEEEKDVVYGKCTGPEPGYIATSKMIVALARTVLNYRDELPFDGGVMLPGAAFGECEEAYKTLGDEGIRFQVVDDPFAKEADDVDHNDKSDDGTPV